MICRECPKCGHDNAAVKYDRVLEALDLECMLCGYRWQAKPLDVVKADMERQAAQKPEWSQGQAGSRVPLNTAPASLKGEKP